MSPIRPNRFVYLRYESLVCLVTGKKKSPYDSIGRLIAPVYLKLADMPDRIEPQKKTLFMCVRTKAMYLEDASYFESRTGIITPRGSDTTLTFVNRYTPLSIQQVPELHKELVELEPVVSFFSKKDPQ